MPLFVPGDAGIQWESASIVQLVEGYGVVFGSNVVYEAYVFALLNKLLGSYNLLGAGCSEKEVEDLVDAAEVPVVLFVMDSLGQDSGASLVKRMQKIYPKTKSVLLVNSLETYRKNPTLPDVFDGVVSATSIGRGGINRCLQVVFKQGSHYVDPLLRDVPGSRDNSLLCSLNHRERSILPLLTRGLTNKQIARELCIAETTTRDYVSSILAKLQVSNRAAAAAWATSHGMVSS